MILSLQEKGDLPTTVVPRASLQNIRNSIGLIATFLYFLIGLVESKWNTISPTRMGHEFNIFNNSNNKWHMCRRLICNQLLQPAWLTSGCRTNMMVSGQNRSSEIFTPHGFPSQHENMAFFDRVQGGSKLFLCHYLFVQINKANLPKHKYFFPNLSQISINMTYLMHIKLLEVVSTMN